MSNVFKSVQVSVSSDWVDSAYKALTVCYHPESYGDGVEREKKINKITSVLRKGHLSIARYISINIHLELIPHDVCMQLRTHKFLDCQVTSQRYTGDHLMEGDISELAEKYFYFKSPGKYTYRGGSYEITERRYDCAKESQAVSIVGYRFQRKLGVPEEVARCVLAQGIRQSMMIRTNVQALMDVIKVRTVQDAQYEVREVVDEIIKQLPTELDPIMTPFLKKYCGKNTSTF